MAKKEDLTGLKFNRLTVIKWSRKRGHKNLWQCKCDCGNVSDVEVGALKSGKTISCGCYSKERISKATILRNTKHNLSKSRIYRIWFDMVRRCTDDRRPKYKDYGGRGILVADEWLDFENFLKDIGMPENESLSLDRIDNNKGYNKINCRWADIKTQANNRRNNSIHIINGETLTMSQISEKFNIRYTTLRSRLYRGWKIEDAIK